MIIFIIHDRDVLAFKPKGNSPISADINCPGCRSISFQFVQPKPWKAQILGLSGSVKAAEYQTESFRVLGLDSRSLSRFEEAL